MSAATTFSYAQAAKGRNAPQPDPQSAASPVPVDPAKDDNSSVTTAADASAKTFSTTSEASDSVKSSDIDFDPVASKAHSEVANTGDSDGSATSAKSESTLVPRPDDASRTGAQSTTSEKTSRPSNRPSESSERKGRKGKKGKNSDKDAEGDQVQQEEQKEVVPVKLYEAPPPAVNVWQQRAAAAKARQPSVTPAPAGTDATAKAVPQDSKSTSTAVSAETKDTSETIRPGKAADGSRQASEQAPRRNPRGSRAGDQVTNGNVPPVQDASLWPTPETAAAEDSKRKLSESDAPSKDKQEEGSQTKSTRPKYVQKLEINHSVKWETQLQTRPATKARGGGQTARNSVGRGAHASSASVSGDKLHGASEAQGPAATSDSQGKPREDAPPRMNAVPFDKKKFSADTRDIRKTSATAERRAGAPSESHSAPKSEATKGPKGELAQGFGGHQSGSRGEGAEHGRKEGGFAGHKDARPRRGAHGNGRGGHSGSQSYSQAYQGNGHGPRPNAYNQPSFGNGYYGGPGPGRPGRGRPASINGYKGPLNGAGKLSMQPLNTDFPPFSPYGQGPHSAFASFPSEHEFMLHYALRQQIEYYFSDNNLPKDLFLRENMDSQGFVPLNVITEFNRIRTLSQQNLQSVREACSDSEQIDFVLVDGKTELLRRREGWEKYVLPEANRKEHARNSGPTSFESKSRHSMHVSASGYHQQGMPFTFPVMSPPAFGGPFPGAMYPGYVNGPGYNHQGVNGGSANGHRADDSQLNAAVPEFAPGNDPLFNGFAAAALQAPGPWVDEALNDAEKFSDDAVAKLHVVASGQSKKSQDVVNLPNGDNHDGAEDSKGVETNGVYASSDALNT
jgi:la-related protein 1